MFDKKLFITRGIKENLSEELQIALWSILFEANKNKQELDYLQVFEISNADTEGAIITKIKWSQEVPPFEKEMYLPLVKCEKEMKVWVISEGEGTEDEYATMLLPEEY